MLLRNNYSFDLIVKKLHDEIPNLIALKKEWTYWDFKREWYNDNTSLLHDILCMSNNLDREISYIIIGIDEEKDFSVNDVEKSSQTNRKNTQQLNDFLSKVHWANGRWPFVLVEPLFFQNGIIDVIAIVQSREDMPYYLDRPNGAIHPFAMHTRRGDSNTPIGISANWNEASSLWSHHFGLDSSPLERVQGMLKDKENWSNLSNYGLTSEKYYRFSPEFTIGDVPDDDLGGYEYYMLTQYDAEPHWYFITIKYFQTPLFDCQGIALDGGRYFTPVPNRSFLKWPNSNILEPSPSYCYFIQDSIEWDINRFYFDDDRGEEDMSQRRFFDSILLFVSEEERINFERIVVASSKEFNLRMERLDNPYGVEKLPEEYTEEGKSYLLFEMKQAIVLRKMLEEVRNGAYSEWYCPTSQKW